MITSLRKLWMMIDLTLEPEMKFEMISSSFCRKTLESNPRTNQAAVKFSSHVINCRIDVFHLAWQNA